MADIDSLSAAQRERLVFIEWRLWFLGEVTRKDLVGRFGVATAAGTRDLALYQSLAPDNLAYVGKVHRYLPTFRALFNHSPERILSALAEGFGDGERHLPLGLLPCASSGRRPLPDLEVLARITRAICGGYALHLVYHPLDGPPGERNLLPHALVQAGPRWLVRAYDRSRERFMDLALSGMDEVEELRHVRAAWFETPEADQHWQRWLELDLVPHPLQPRAAAIMREFGMHEGKLRLRVRAAQVAAVLKEWQIDAAPAPQADPGLLLRLTNPAVLTGVPL